MAPERFLTAYYSFRLELGIISFRVHTRRLKDSELTLRSVTNSEFRLKLHNAYCYMHKWLIQIDYIQVKIQQNVQNRSKHQMLLVYSKNSAIQTTKHGRFIHDSEIQPCMHVYSGATAAGFLVVLTSSTLLSSVQQFRA